jgi:Fe-S cluster assembly iron-binding protein IscA
MLVLTDAATSAVRRLAEHPDLPDDGGLRIAGPDDGSEALTATAAPEPIDGDQVVEQDGARIFLEPSAAELLDDKVLDAKVDDRGVIQFRLATQ